ncbi:Unconventional myosin-Ih [Willisornis vidua]|uniref:Unconventional myosin-Ih n=1 Tax=Willisornis vidua TaxID=1566151 RepID=A0ABQ9DCW6_9PASS|nr:Unconventional myosin-Ih [Willisornis vidua]
MGKVGLPRSTRSTAGMWDVGCAVALPGTARRWIIHDRRTMSSPAQGGDTRSCLNGPQLQPRELFVAGPGGDGRAQKEEVDDNTEEIMEGALIARDRVGVQDFVLLDSHTSEAAFLSNLRKRYQENLIYTYIGTLLVSVNPYKELDIYTVTQMQLYRGVNFFELPPHLYAIADNAYRVMCSEYNNHFILISGESGAGKTEASKKILQYYAVTCPTTEQLQIVRDRLLLSNPVLEARNSPGGKGTRDGVGGLTARGFLQAFGNAKTLRNDNSSRFGKYMDIQFDFKGAPVGGHILSYLIEKSRVVHQNHGERNFHIFYQLLEGGEKDLLCWLGLERNPQKYTYLIQGRCAKVFSINDKNDWKIVRKAFSIIDFSEKDIEQLFGIVASVLHLGNIQFEEDSNGHAIIRDGTQIKWISKLLGSHLSILQEALTHRKIEARSEEVLSPLNVDLAFYARDALAKAIYGRTFSWLVNKINGSLANKDSTQKTVIGLLDIYGFEVLDTNSFEQFCINYCNEKLQQLLIEMTLKAEQEEYELEGIEWEPIPYFNNKIICDLVEQKHKGIISILVLGSVYQNYAKCCEGGSGTQGSSNPRLLFQDEECLRPGEATDLSFLEKLEEKVGDHAHFVTYAFSSVSYPSPPSSHPQHCRKLADQKTRKSIDWVDFRLLHYAGEVTYCAVGFLEKNNDLLYRNLKEVLCNSKNGIIRDCFLLSELDNRRRPETVATQFKNSLTSLIEILMSKEPSYIRCIKPNENKEPGKFDDFLIRHQVKYLGLMEHLRVRRAGFAYRRKYELFLQRYKCLCPATWPNWNGTAAEGVERLIKHIGYKPEEYKLGRTKIFIRFPKTLFATEDAFEYRKHLLISRLQAKYKGFLGKRAYQKKRKAAIKLEACWRGALARREAKKRTWAVQTIRKFITGFINRKKPLCPENREFVRLAQYNYLVKLRDHLPKNVLDKSWLQPPSILEETSELLQKICMRNLVRKYCRGVTAERKAQLQQKVVTSAVFRGKKEGYVQSINQPFLDTRLKVNDINPKVLQLIQGETIKYVTPVIKYDRNGFKARERLLVLTQSSAYVVEMAKVKQKIDYAMLKGISTSNLSDGIVVIHVPEDNKQKGDVILQCEHLFETVTKLCMLANKQSLVKVVQGSLRFRIGSGKEGTMVFTVGKEPQVFKDKNGQLTVVSTQVKS